ncbi:winged helix-turn-helix domain-containing protein [Deinococcus sp. KNUC1210]|uniref:winged helix-turn-helix domain-containing protein n=1 Tax=Deinococcus sp. KNUC1210 TaxID=2917691 RepID=UPI00351CBEB3
MRAVIGRQFSLWHHRDHVRNILHQLSCSCQKLDQRALEQNPEAVAPWIRTSLPKIKKRATEATLVIPR